MSEHTKVIPAISILRNWYGFNEETIRVAQREVCNEVEKLRKQRDELLEAIECLPDSERTFKMRNAIAKVKGQS